MNFELSSELVELRNEVDAFATERLASGALTRAADPAFPRSVLPLLAARGWSGLAAADPGLDGGVLAGTVAIEALARRCPRSADALHQMNFAAALLLDRYASLPEHRELLSAILAGTRVAAVAITETGAGAQAVAVESRVKTVGGEMRLDGHKRYVSSSADADVFIVYARFGDTAGEVGAAVVRRDQPGLVLGDPVLFMNGERWRPIDFRSVRLGEADILFRNGGFTEKGGFFDIEKIGHAARALGLGWCAFDLARNYVSERRQFGRPLCEFQGIQWKLAEARLALEAAQLTLYRAAVRADRGALRGEDASCAKVLCNRAAMGTCDMAVQVMGGAGFSGEQLAEYCFRKARGHMINGGVVELMLTRIAEGIFERKFPQHPD